MKIFLLTVVAAVALTLPSFTASAMQRQGEVRSAKYRGGQGATWKMGRDTHGFAGNYGKCRYTGMAGPNGYRLDKNC